MILFIDLRHYEDQLGGDRFAFFNTVTGRFLEDAFGAQTWVCAAELVDPMIAKKRSYLAVYTERCLGLLPPWAHI